MVARRVYDSDIVIHRDSLTRIAEQYVDEYTGNFEFMVEVKRTYYQLGFLPNQHLRGVLNAIRVDASRYDLYRQVTDLLGSSGAIQPLPRERKLRLVKPEDSRVHMWDAPTRVKAEYGVALRGKVYHLVGSAICRWSRPTRWGGIGSDQTKPLTVVTLMMKWQCGVTTKNPTLHLVVPEGMTMCVGCHKISNPTEEQ